MKKQVKQTIIYHEPFVYVDTFNECNTYQEGLKIVKVIGVYKIDDYGYATLAEAWKVVSKEEKFYEFKSEIDLQVGSKINIKGELSEIKDIIHELDNSVTYIIEDKLLQVDDYEDRLKLLEGEFEAYNETLLERKRNYEQYSNETYKPKKTFWEKLFGYR